VHAAVELNRMSRIVVERAGAAQVRVDGRDLAAFAGCDYLGLSHAPEVAAALARGLATYGVSSSASRATTGDARAHDELEYDLARFLGTEAALLVPDGYLSNLVVAQALAARVDSALVDREAHVSVLDALAAASIRPVVYDFCDVDSAAAEARTLGGLTLALFTDGAYPVMKGIAPLRGLLAVLPRDGVLVVDDAHATGVLGRTGRGSLEHHEIDDPRIVVTGTLSKALGCFGGFVAGRAELVELARERSRAYVGSTPIPPALALAGSAAVALLEREPQRLERLRSNVEGVRAVLKRAGIAAHDLPLPVFAWKAESPEQGDRAHARLRERGVLVPHVHYPDGLGSYFRLAVSAAHDTAAIARLENALEELARTP
jgi:7-keto-8-aminopelargonate synthetase-like enzyme